MFNIGDIVKVIGLKKIGVIIGLGNKYAIKMLDTNQIEYYSEKEIYYV